MAISRAINMCGSPKNTWATLVRVLQPLIWHGFPGDSPIVLHGLVQIRDLPDHSMVV